jgi:bifunctional ADP-heptose synthase (sugar kinase/adenylyltransferase)
MEYTYTEVLNEAGKVIAVNRSDGWWIPADPANSDYQRYLNPKAEQSTPNLSDEA